MPPTKGDASKGNPKMPSLTLRAQAEWLFRKGEFKKALDAFTAALNLCPGEKKCLIGRSKCYVEMKKFDEALKDADASLKDDKTFCEGLSQKAEILYHVGEFEFALVFYRRGQKIRPQMEEFRLGVQKAQEAIENYIGRGFTHELKVMGELSFLKEDEERVKPITVLQNLAKVNTLQTQRTPKNEKIAKKLLGEFYDDKIFLEKLMKNEDLIKGETKQGERPQDLIQSRLTSLNAYTEFMVQQKKMSFQKPQSLQRKSSSSSKSLFVSRSIKDINAGLDVGDAEGSLKKGQDLMMMLQTWSKKELPEKEGILGSLHACIGNALFDLGDMENALKHHHESLELARKCKLPEAISSALNNVGHMYALKGEFSHAIKYWEEQIHFVSKGLDRTWLFHEIGCCYLELNHPEKSRDYGIRSEAAAERIEDEKWQLNANALIAHSEYILGNFESSVTYFEKALSLAKKDKEALRSIHKALDAAKELALL